MHDNYFEQFLETPERKKLTKVNRETAIRREGEAIVVPEKYTYKAAADALYERAKMEEEPMSRLEKFTCHPNDGFIAITRLINETFGFTQVRSEMFNSAQTKRVKTGINVTDYEEALCGGVIGIPMLPDIEIRVGGDEDDMQFYCQVKAKEKHARAVNSFLDELRRRIETESIYKGKAFDSRFEFLNLSGATEEKVVLPLSTAQQVRANLYTPLEHRNLLRRVGTEFGRSILLEGPYGTGKTLLAFVAGAKAVDNDITFVYVRSEDAHKLPLYMRYARQYAPAVLFYEDIDMLMGTDDDDRDVSINLVLNTLDGIDAKAGNAQDVMLVMTTNDVNSINEALMRPGRIDAVIHIGLPDAYAAGQLIRQYGGDSLSLEFNESVAGNACNGMTPAFIREVVERSKLVALSRDPSKVDHLEIEAADIMVAADQIKEHQKLASPRVKTHTTGDRLASALTEVVERVVAPVAEAWGPRLGVVNMPDEKPLPLHAVSNGESSS